MTEICYVKASRHADALQAKEVELALRSGVHTSVSWSLNVLTVLSFNTPHQLLLSDLPELLQALLQVQHARLHAFTCSAVVYMLNYVHKLSAQPHSCLLGHMQSHLHCNTLHVLLVAEGSIQQ